MDVPDDAAELLAEALEGLDVDADRLAEAEDVLDAWDTEDEGEEAAQEAFDPSAHPRAAAGTAAGGQFTAAGGGSAASGKAAAQKTRKKGEALGFDAKSGRGTGYGRKGGDARVRKLQAALNRLGLKDADGRRLVVDGKLGPRTTAAIKAAQKKLGLPADGKVTPQMLAKLVAAKSLNARQKAGDRPKPKPGATGRSVGKAAGGAAAAAARRMSTETTTSGGRTVTRRTREAGMTVEQPEGTHETQDRIEGRVLEAAGTDEAGNRVFRVRIISAGESKNGRRYPAKVLQEAAGLYEGAKAYDHHRTPEELRTSTINGLVGFYRNVEASDDGLDGDLVLLPGARHTAEALDATVAAQAANLPPLVGISHDALTYTRPVTAGRRRLMEAVSIAKVNSADVVADPAAGGMATRVLAGGIEETDPADAGESNEEDDVPITSETVLAALKDASPEDLAAVGLSKVEQGAAPEQTTEASPAGVEKASFIGRLMIKEKVAAAGLPERVVESLAETLPDRIAESDIDAQVAALKTAMGFIEREHLMPTATAQVTQESLDKKKAALDAFFERNWTEGYTSFRQAYLDITGHRPQALGEDLNRQILRESFGGGFDSNIRTTESMDSTTWAQMLGDSITRRVVAEYRTPSLQAWRQIVSSIEPVGDFRTQRVGRTGGYGLLPTVPEGAPYQPLTSPGDEEATGALSKKGGTEDVTLEMIANDDRRQISQIPRKLGRAAAQTIYRDVFDTLVDNDTATYDSTALFHSNHANTDTSAGLAQSTLSTGRRKMIEQAAYGNSTEILALTPKFLIVPPELEEIAFQLTSSAVAIPSSGNSSDIPNIHARNLMPILVPYLTDGNDWFLVADPADVPTLEVGFYNGRQEPEIFTQSDQNVGSVFNADVFTWKIRFIYYVMILDHRGFYRGQG